MNYELKLALDELRSALGTHYGAAFVHQRVATIMREVAKLLADNAKQRKDLAALAACNAGYAERERELLGRLEALQCDNVSMRDENEQLSEEVERLKLKAQIEEGKSRACMDMIREMASAQVRPVLLCTNPAHIEKEMD